MKTKNIKGFILLVLTVAFTACSNLIDSAYMPIPPNENVILSVPFATDMGGFKTKNIAGLQEWTLNSSGYVGMTGYVGGVYNVNEDWLISPVIDLTNVATANFSFDYVAHLMNVNSDITVYVSDIYTDDSIPSITNMMQVNVNLIPDPGSYVFSNTGQISITKYAGKKIRIAIKYISSTTTAGTFELKNFIVQKGEAVSNPLIIFSEPLYGNLGNFTIQNVIGAQTWVQDSKYACMTMSGYSGSRYANEDWLISPEIDLQTITESYFTFDQTGNYFTNINADATVWISDNYSSGLPSTATWIQAPVLNYFNGSTFTWVSSGPIDLSAYSGKKIHVAFKYTCTTAVAGTWELRNFQVFKGKTDGVQTLPFKISDAVKYQSGGNAWVEGYIVGYAWQFLNQFAYYNSVDSCSQKTNILLADTTNNVYSVKCLSVQLPRGVIRNGLNLISNKSIFGQKVKIYGTLSPNMGISGLLSPTQYILSDGTTGIASPSTTFFSETFGSSLGNFTQSSIVGPSQYWKFSSGYGAVMTGFANSVNNPNEDWLYSPIIDLTTLSSAALKFDHAINKGDITKMTIEQTLWISVFDGTNWSAYTQIRIPTYPSGNTWNYVNSGEIDLDAYAGKKIKIAFKYACTSASSATWEIKNFLVYY
jgi:hypothetical protein